MTTDHRSRSRHARSIAWLSSVAAATMLGLTACSTHDTTMTDAGTPISGDASASRVIPIGPEVTDFGAPPMGEPYDLSEPGAVVWRSQPASIVDTRDFPVQIQDVTGPPMRMKDILPEHQKPRLDLPGQPNTLAPGNIAGDPITRGTTTFTGLDRTGWTPPDPAIAVGPNHVVQVVNQSLAFYTKAGDLQFSAILGSQGSPGFFEDVGAGGFAFDPKCFYDHIAERYIVLALEFYQDQNASFVTIAISDDDDPNGVWFKYRTDAVIEANNSTYWWDYPGLGYDEEAWYVTSNLFIIQGGGPFGGVGYRVFDKDAMLVGDPAVFATLRDPGGASVQVAQHFGDNQAPYFMGVANTSSMRVSAITNPTTNPQLVSTTVTVPNFNQPGQSDVAGGGSISAVDLRLMNVVWRDGNLYTGHTTAVGGTNKARWYHMDTQDWPNSGSVALVQTGIIDPGPGIDTFFPAIYSDDNDNVALTFGRSSSSERVAMYVTGRTPSAPAGTMAEPVLVQLGTASGSTGRWGDYYDMAIDPTDGLTFWGVGQTDESGIGWDTWIHSFAIADVPLDISIDLASVVPSVVSPDTSFDIDFTVDLGSDTLVGTPALLAGQDLDAASPINATNIGGTTWRVTVPTFDCEPGAFALRLVATGQQSGVVTFPEDNGQLDVLVGETKLAFEDDFQADQGWTVSGDATDGQWNRGVPVGGGDRGDPPTDFDGSGACYLTDNVDGNSDVDGGSTVLTSPLLSYSSPPVIEYARWFDNAGGSAAQQDVFTVEYSTDGGVNWTNLETVGPAGPEVFGGWIQKQFDLTGLVPDAGSLRVRFTASDTGDGSVVEAGVDAVRLTEFTCGDECPADFDASGAVNVLDVVAFITAWQQSDPATDIRPDGQFNILDVVDFIAIWNAGCP